MAVVNGAFPLINQLKVDFNGANVLDTPGINHAFNVKNLSFPKTIAREVDLVFSQCGYNYPC